MAGLTEGLPRSRLTSGGQVKNFGNQTDWCLSHPAAADLDQRRQFIRHVLRLANRAPHAGSRRLVPALHEKFPAVAAPVFAEEIASKDAALELSKICCVEQAFRTGIEIVRVVEHQTCLVRVAEEFESADLRLAARVIGGAVVE